jgi:hypothetical protein
MFTKVYNGLNWVHLPITGTSGKLRGTVMKPRGSIKGEECFKVYQLLGSAK